MSETSLLSHVTANDLFNELDETILKVVEGELDLHQLNEGEILFKQGDPGDNMFFLVQGCLGVVLGTFDGREIIVGEETEPGTSVGEMALVTGQPRMVTVSAVSESELVKLSRKGFDSLVKKQPQLLADLANMTAPRWRRAQLAVVLVNLLGELDALALRDLQAELEWCQLSHGELLFNQGDPGDSMYIVVNGRLRIVAMLPNGDERELDEIGSGEIVGEFALITGEPRTATVYAIRETNLVKMTQPVFTRLLERHPQAMIQITRKIISRHPSSIRVSAPDSMSAFNVALVPASQDVPLDAFTQQLAACLEKSSRVLHLSSARFDHIYDHEGTAQTPLDDPMTPVLDSWMSEQETRYQYILFAADPVWSTWTRRCLRQADRILIVGQSHKDPTPGPVELALKSLEITTRTELVLLHSPSVTRPSGTSQWLSRRRVHAHYQVRAQETSHMQRLARRLTGQTIGLVLSGGAARGFAHLGVFRALDELGIQIDFIGGTSMGALMGAGYAMGLSSKDMVELAHEFANPKRLFDYTLPLVSLMASKKVTKFLIELCGDLTIEDLWLPYFCVSSNLSRAEPVIHQEGLLWKSVRASVAIPGIFLPILHEGDVLADGGAMNNFPVDILRERFAGQMIIGVNVSLSREKEEAYHFGSSLSGWRVLWNRINPFIEPIQAPKLVPHLMRALEINSAYQIKTNKSMVDLLIQPDVKEYGMLDFAEYDAISEIGYEAAREELVRWKSRLPIKTSSHS
ncbi:MAG: cyclic nucleotide-binding domain-containing protein [Anaerolineaceae bacterium]|nr:MAG: cyclic nucleotide-binding domain-containing protein [Anaerolineaceae bacterium]